jgi:hypothetical protein
MGVRFLHPVRFAILQIKTVLMITRAKTNSCPGYGKVVQRLRLRDLAPTIPVRVRTYPLFFRLLSGGAYPRPLFFNIRYSNIYFIYFCHPIFKHMDIFQHERNELERENWATALGRVPLLGPRDEEEEDDDDDDDDEEDEE